MFVRWSNLTAEQNEQRSLPGYRDPAAVRRFDAPQALQTRFYEVRARSVLNRVPDSSQMPFRWTVNPYRGCSHACVYCFARPTHKYLGFDAGRDFEREIVVKVNAPEVLRAELARRTWKREHVALGTNTDPYQWVEGRYRLMEGIWAALRDAANPCSVLTKSPLLLRDLPLLLEIQQRTTITACLSIPTLDEKAWRASEPHTPNPRARLEAVAELNRAGIPTGVLIAPLMPGINDAPHQLEPLLELARRASAGSRCTCAARCARCSWTGFQASARTCCRATGSSTAAAPTCPAGNAAASRRRCGARMLPAPSAGSQPISRSCPRASSAYWLVRCSRASSEAPGRLRGAQPGEETRTASLSTTVRSRPLRLASYSAASARSSSVSMLSGASAAQMPALTRIRGSPERSSRAIAARTRSAKA